MDRVLQEQAMQMKQNRKHRKGWQAFVRMLALCVVFCTTYVLVLPAITLQHEPICGMQEHVHTEQCRSRPAAAFQNCGIPAEAFVIHQHGELCRNEAGELICDLAEQTAHTHTESCYTRQEELHCSALHVHSESCRKTEAVLTCAEPESEGHTHTEGCFLDGALVCEHPESQGHAHGEDCFETVEIPCTLQIPADHVHDENCYLITETLTCGQEEPVLVVEHIHTEACLVTGEPELLCAMEEHIHTEECFPEEEKPPVDEKYLCGTGVHAHNEGCLDETGALVCSIPEHSHEAACLVADLDLTADVETEKDWMRSVSAMIRSGNWPADVVAVAETQLGYRESSKNVILKGDDLKGYTRYGAWYGDPYGDWCAMYASFCLRYAGVEDYPLEAGVDRWIETLTEAGYYAASDVYTGKPGDLIFFDQDQKADAEIAVDADHVGIVAELNPATEEEPAKIKTIEGTTRHQVAYRTYELTDPTIIGYGQLPAGELFRLTHEGGDYTVTVTVTPETGIPDTAVLAVREIGQGTEEYDTYYQQSLAALTGEEAPEISFARFFDISFLVDGREVEPEAPVDIEIIYTNAVSMTEEEAGQIVHFAADGIEVLTPSTSLTESENEEAEGVDTFRFTQGSFSVTGTLVGTQAVTATATKVQPNEIDNTGNTMYVLVAQINGRYYALNGNGKPVAVTFSNNTVTRPADKPMELCWTFVDKPNDDGYYLYNPVQNVGTGRHLHPYNGGVTTDGAWDLKLEVTNDTFKIRGNGEHRIRMTEQDATAVTNQNQATSFFAAVVGSVGRNYNVWVDGTLGGMMSYYGAANTNIPAAAGEDGTAVVELPETWQTSPKYDYVLQGWYDINTQTYYPVDPYDNIRPTATISGNTVFYADWIGATYDVGQDNEHVVDSIDTNDFITTHVFDYNALFNVMSQYHTGNITAGGHTETWTIYNNGERVPYRNMRSLGFAFVDYDAGGDFSYANDRDVPNTNQGTAITSGILDEVRNNSGQDLLDLLFNPDTEVIGKYYAGQGNYLFQYMDSTTENFDGEHDGYYYLDSRLNAASYNQSQQRFYLYDYLERTSDSRKDGGA